MCDCLSGLQVSDRPLPLLSSERRQVSSVFICGRTDEWNRTRSRRASGHKSSEDQLVNQDLQPLTSTPLPLNLLNVLAALQYDGGPQDLWKEIAARCFFSFFLFYYIFQGKVSRSSARWELDTGSRTESRWQHLDVISARWQWNMKSEGGRLNCERHKHGKLYFCWGQ